MFFRQVFEPKLAQYSYIVGCQATGEALVIDPMRDIERYLEIAAEEELRITAGTETHIHADFLSGCRRLADRTGARLYLSAEGGDDWQYAWPREGEYEVEWLRDGTRFRVGNIELRAVHTPGHTPEHLSFMITDFGGGANQPIGIATGDFVFVGDLGRPDLLETAAGVEGAMTPSAQLLYRSSREFLDLEDYLQVWPGHGAGSACGKALGAVPDSTVGYERRFSPALAAARGEESAFVDFILADQPEPPLYFARMKRDNKLGPAPLDDLPSPRRLAPDELAQLHGRAEVALIDTRRDRREFMAGHLAASLCAPLDRHLPTVAGSYVEEAMPIYLLLDRETDLDEAVLDLVRIGLDRIEGYATAADLKRVAESVELSRIEVLTFEAAAEGDGIALDVRRLDEFRAGHLEGAIHVPHTRLLVQRDKLPPGRPLLTYCRTGRRAAGASSVLARLGYPVRYVDDEIARAPLLVTSPALAEGV